MRWAKRAIKAWNLRMNAFSSNSSKGPSSRITLHSCQPLSFFFLPPFLPEEDLKIPENQLYEEFLEWRPNDRWDGDSIRLRDMGVFCIDDDLSPSWESLEGLCTQYTGHFGDLDFG